MPEYDYFKFSTSGLPRFVRSQSFSHNHNHHHRPRHSRAAARCPDNCACVTLDDWTALSERERLAHAASEKLARDNRSLKSDLRAAYDETRRLQDEVAQLRGRASRDEDVAAAKFRRRLAELKAEVDDKERALRDLGRAKDLADVRVRELTQTVTDQGVEVSQLADDVERLGRALKKDQLELGVRKEEAREAWSLVNELRRQLRRCRDPLAFRRRYDFA
ncbi:hypothetical protein F5X97DRAFT_194518 [Nemania serpens]|nr:hypothetical protein F5X97DRAFT_194518 [Nemania serpens]